MKVEQSVAHPPVARIEVMCGAHTVSIRPWTMAQRAELRPRVADIIDRIMQLQMTPATVDLAQLFVHAENEIAEIVRASIELPDGLTWDQLLWEDLPSLAQAVWEIAIVRADGGGLAGKVMGVVAEALSSKTVLDALLTSQQPSATSSSDSPSLPDAGAPTPSA